MRNHQRRAGRARNIGASALDAGPARGMRSRLGRAQRSIAGVLVASCVMMAAAAHADGPALRADEKLMQLDRALNWTDAKLIAVQDQQRYKTLDSFARESMQAMTGKEHFDALSPMASLLEWLFNRDAYVNERVIFIKDRGLRIHFSAHMPIEAAQSIRAAGYMSLREFMDPTVAGLKRELAPRTRLRPAMGRIGAAQSVAVGLESLIRIVPRPSPDAHDQWCSPVELIPNLPESVRGSAARDGQSAGEMSPRVEGIDEQTALALVAPWASLKMRWLARDTSGVQEALDKLARILPTLAKPGEYPSVASRRAEAHYYAMGKLTWGWMLYSLGAVIAVWAVVTRWRVPWYASMLVLLAALGLHAYGIGLRWYILERIPVANMFEAVVASAWAGIALGILLELVYRTRVFLLAAHLTGFMALMLAQYIIPGGGTLTSIRMILDDVMLRIHTTLIIWSYALIFLGGVIAIAYLFGYYLHTARERSAEAGMVTALAGLSALLVTYLTFTPHAAAAADGGYLKNPNVTLAFSVAALISLATLISLALRRAAGNVITLTAILFVACATVAIGDYPFAYWMSIVMLAGGLTWLAGTLLGAWLLRERSSQPALALAGAGGLALAGGMTSPLPRRPLMAGGAPGDEAQRGKLPQWLYDFDWSHLIILNLVFVMLFVGIILGAIWADYSWGRPWGWDPKEVFAMNTWIIYAIVMHVRFFVAQRGLWTAWLSVAGCLMMAFNWVFVNFYIVGLHSYA